MKKLILLALAFNASSVFALDYFFANTSLGASNNYQATIQLPACTGDGANVPVSRLSLRPTANGKSIGFLSLTFSDGTAMVSFFDWGLSGQTPVYFKSKKCIRTIKVASGTEVATPETARVTFTGK